MVVQKHERVADDELAKSIRNLETLMKVYRINKFLEELEAEKKAKQDEEN